MAGVELTYAIPDIHGCADLLKLAVGRIIDHRRGRQAKIVTLGDYVDRGPQSAAVLEFIMNWPDRHPRLIVLKGNHEVMMLAACLGQAKHQWWMQNGGAQTFASYGLDPANPADLRRLPAAHLQFIAQLPRIHVDQHRIFVHAGVDPDQPLETQSERTLLWKRYEPQFEQGHGQRHVVHGHDASPSGPLLTAGRTNLDCMAWKTGRLAIAVFDDAQPGGPREILEVETSR